MPIFEDLHWVVLICHFLLFSACFYFLKLEKDSGFSFRYVLGLFGLKVAAGLIHLSIHFRDYNSTNDIRMYYELSLREQAKAGPRWWLHEWLLNWGDIRHHLNFFHKANLDYWNNLGSLIHYKYMCLANLLTGNHLWADLVFYNAIYFAGMWLLYKTFYRMQPERKWGLLCMVFMIPSVMFWCSGIHKDGWVLAAIGGILWNSVRLAEQFSWRLLAGMLAGMALLFVVRYFICLCFMLPFILWVWYRYKNWDGRWLPLLYVLLVGLFFISGEATGMHVTDIILSKREAFRHLHGMSDLQLPACTSSVSCFLQTFMASMNHVWLRPYFHWADALKFQVAALDSWMLALLFVILLVQISRQKQEAFYYFLISFALSMYLFIGFTVPNMGAIVRYKSENTVLLFTALYALAAHPDSRLFRKK